MDVFFVLNLQTGQKCPKKWCVNVLLSISVIGIIGPSRERSRLQMSKEEYLEYIRNQPYDAMGDFGFLLKEEPAVGSSSGMGTGEEKKMEESVNR